VPQHSKPPLRLTAPRLPATRPPNTPRSVAAGLAIGAALRPLAPPWFRRHTVAAAGLGNVGNLPLVLVAALVQEAGSHLGQVRRQL
jgi:uncharacterized protein (DUF2062 family)